MYPRGIIYEKGTRKRHGEVILKAPLTTRILFGIGKMIGEGLVVFAIAVIFLTFLPVLREEIDFKLSKGNIKESGFGEILEKARADNSSFSVVIPKIGAKSKIIANVDAGNESEYLSALKIGVAHAKGTFFPGQGKNIFLFAHSTSANPFDIGRLNAVFYLLRKLEKGDKIIVFFGGKKFEYAVAKKVVVKASDTSWFNDNEGGGDTLILQTCDPPGTTFKRLLVIAKPKN